MKNRKSIGSFLYLAILMFIIIGIFFAASNRSKPKPISYGELVDLFKNEQVEEFEMVGTEVSCLLKDGTVVTHSIVSFQLFQSTIIEKYVIPQQEAGIITYYNFKEGFTLPWWASFIPYLLIFGALIFFWWYTTKQMNGKAGGGFGKARVKMGSDEKDHKTFADVAGADQEKAELEEIVDFLKSPRKYLELGARIPKGVLLVGRPGTGKTLIAKATAGEAKVPFFSISGSDFVELYVGVGASRVRDLFDQAKKNSPCIVFIDEIDAVGRHRGAGIGGGHDEREHTLNQLLVEMDGFGTHSGIIVMAATNRVDTLDPALMRAGRFDRQIYIGKPDQNGREEILKVHARGKTFDPDVDFHDIAKSTVGFTGADIENLLNEAALLAARRNKSSISDQDIQDSVMKVIAGPEKKSRKIIEKERRLTAYHEAGHAVVSKFLPTADEVREISIIPRGMAGGYTMSLPKEDLSYSTKNMMFEEIISLLGGRVSEKLNLDDISTGASNDIQRATSIARAMVTRYGMSDKLGPVLYGSDSSEVFLGYELGNKTDYSEHIAAQIDDEVKAIIESAYEKAEKILSENADKVKAIAERLLEKEKISGTEFYAIMDGKDPDDLAHAENNVSALKDSEDKANNPCGADPSADIENKNTDNTAADASGASETDTVADTEADAAGPDEIK